jgi:regulator of protease activity HflC (stomatin/prohibitin superfamily)
VKKINEIALGIAGIIVAIAVLLLVRSIYVVKQWQKVAVIRFARARRLKSNLNWTFKESEMNGSNIRLSRAEKVHGTYIV